MIDLLEALTLADAGFDLRVRQGGAGDWKLATPCVDWDVYRLVNHVVVGGGRYGRLVRGGTRDAFIAERQIDALVDGAVAAWGTWPALSGWRFSTSTVCSPTCGAGCTNDPDQEGAKRPYNDTDNALNNRISDPSDGS